MPNYDFRILGDCQKDKKKAREDEGCSEIETLWYRGQDMGYCASSSSSSVSCHVSAEGEEDSGNEEEQVLGPSLSSLL